MLGFIFSGLIVPVASFKLKLAGWLCIVFCGVVAIGLFPRLVGDDVRVRISASGIYVGAWSDDTIPWSEISRVSTWGSKGKSEIIVLDLSNPDRFPSTTLAGLYWKMNSLMVGGDIWVSLLGTDGKIGDALAAIDCFRNVREPPPAPERRYGGFGRRRV